MALLGTRVLRLALPFLAVAASAQTASKFHELPPCRIVDTRQGGGILDGLRSFKVSGADGFTEQGGKDGGCGIPRGASAAVINFVAVAPQGQGNLRAAPYPTVPEAGGSIINYQQLAPALNVANGLQFPLCSHQRDANISPQCGLAIE